MGVPLGLREEARVMAVVAPRKVGTRHTGGDPRHPHHRTVVQDQAVYICFRVTACRLELPPHMPEALATRTRQLALGVPVAARDIEDDEPVELARV